MAALVPAAYDAVKAGMTAAQYAQYTAGMEALAAQNLAQTKAWAAEGAFGGSGDDPTAILAASQGNVGRAVQTLANQAASGTNAAAAAAAEILNTATQSAGPLQTLLGKLAIAVNAPPAVTQVATAVGLAPPKATAANPTAARTILGLPVADVGIGAAAIGAGLWLIRKHL